MRFTSSGENNLGLSNLNVHTTSEELGMGFACNILG